MDFDLSEDQQALREAARALLDDVSGPARAREVSKTPGHYDRELWAEMAKQGWFAVERSASDGGLGLGLVEVAVLGEELGRHLASVPFHGTLLTLGAIGRAVSEGALNSDSEIGSSDVATWVRRLSLGEATGGLAWSRQPDAVTASRGRNGSDVAGGEDGPWSLNGRADPVVYGPSADVVLVFAKVADADGGDSGVFAIADGTGDCCRAERAMDETRQIGWLELSNRSATRIGGGSAARHLLDRAITVLSAEMLGAADTVLSMTVDYAKDRVQFGRPIGSFQAVKHRCADMLVDVEGMRSSSYYAAWAVGAEDPEASTAASAAKVWCSDAARRVMASGLQVHGGIGFTWEHDLHLFLKRSQLDQVSFGDAAFHRRRLVSILRPRAEAGLPIL